VERACRRNERFDCISSRSADPGPKTWRDRTEYGEYGTRLTQAGLRAVAFGPIGAPGDPDGLLVVGTTSAHRFDLGENLPSIAELAVASRLLLGDGLADRRALRVERVRIERLIDDEAFRPVFQPVADLATNRAIGYEALTRFDNGVRPDVMFQAAGRAGAGPDLEAATLAAALDASYALPAGPWLSLNVSAEFLVHDGRLATLLATRTRPIVLEITEHDAIGDYAAVRAAVSRLGPDVRIAVDDAGAGVANFTHIVDLRPDYVKVDRSLVQGLEHDLRRQALVASIHHFARATDAWIIAEGIEQVSERTVLEGLGIAFGQGYLMAPPASATTFDGLTAGIALPRGPVLVDLPLRRRRPAAAV
jgi:EAL domain-containing protein (putative c-di-GMP-specific phosphodiesterase class I)